MTSVRLFEEEEFDEIPFGDDDDALLIRNFLDSCRKGGSTRLISNVQTRMYCLQLDGFFLPVSVNDTEYANSYTVSPYGFIAYAQEELQRFGSRIFSLLLMPILMLIGSLLKWAKVNRVVTVNNLLLSTNLYPMLSSAQIEAAVRLLSRRFPLHTIMWRSLNARLPEGLMATFQDHGGRLILSRQVYIYHRQWLNSKQRWVLKSDRRLIGANGYEVLDGEELTPTEIARVKQLYDLLYLEKYTPLNPQFTEDLLAEGIKRRYLKIIALRKEGRIDGVLGYIRRGDVMTTPIYGYDTTLPQSLGLYRMLTALCVDEADRLDLHLHHSAGAAEFKRTRGMRPELEYMVVYDKHLPWARRLIWGAMAFLLNGLGRPLMTHFKL
ncbi:MAG: GNAT family N-acetyltransferase [Chlamydiia bacterium]|nr:GNAT family N-acetyltransferase [Chlamydiia bacterium]